MQADMVGAQAESASNTRKFRSESRISMALLSGKIY
jgi:hypothetical protein